MLNIETIRRELMDQPDALAQFEALVASGTLKHEITDADLEAIHAGKGGNSNGGNSPLSRMRARFLDEISIHLVSAAVAILVHAPFLVVAQY